MKLFIIAALFSLFFLQHPCLAQSNELADKYGQDAQIQMERGSLPGAIKLLEKAIAAEKESSKPRLPVLAQQYYITGNVYLQLSKYDKAIENLENALEILRGAGQKKYVAKILGDIAALYNLRGRFTEAIASFEEALQINEDLDLKADTSLILNNMGGSYENLGQYEKAINCYEQAKVISEKLGVENDTANSLGNIGRVYEVLGEYEQAIHTLHLAVEINSRLRSQLRVVGNFNVLGNVYNSKGDYDGAVEYYGMALSTAKNINIETEADVAGQPVYLIKAQVEANIAVSLGGMANVYTRRGQYNKALENYREGLEVAKEHNVPFGIANGMNNIGNVYYVWGQFDKAIENYKQSIYIKERIRLTAQGDARRDYLASQIDTYQSLASASLKNTDAQGVLNAIEQSRARVLAEQIAGIDSKIKIPTLEEVQKGLADDEAVLLFSNIDHDNFILMVISDEDIVMKEVSKESFLASTRKQYKEPVLMLLEKQRGIIPPSEPKKNTPLFEKKKQEADFDTAIHYYRTLLTNPTNKKEAKAFGKLLHDLLIMPVITSIKGKTKLIIMPDGILGFLPFETLITPKGRYLVQERNLSYIQSLTIDRLLKNRIYADKQDRKALLAVGGAVYGGKELGVKVVENARQLSFLQNNTDQEIQKSRSVRSAYEQLGKNSWSDLPGTLAEVNEISSIITGGDTLVGEEVTENKVKNYSKSGKLANYKILHFATHGLVVPEMPELSAIVLSQFEEEKDGEDGYLRMGEIAELDIAADFVNLSACETGLGKIFNGEGIVGLTQSFLIAGANGLSVSLWQVADKSTPKFMSELYKKVQNSDIGYGQALSEVKRAFITGDYGEKYQAPYYWSPFVYYGK